MVVLILGVTGMLGSTAFRLLSRDARLTVFGTARASGAAAHVAPDLRDRIVTNVDVVNPDDLASVFAKVRPDVVVNCVGIVKQLASAKDPLVAIPINAILPHRLARLCSLRGARLIHVSTDCVFTGAKGMYREDDPPDADDLYGRSKLLGEVDQPHAITLRTSIIGREVASRNGLVDWFLGERSGRVRGYAKAIFSGLTTDELTRVIARLIERPDLHGLYHVSSAPIDKYSLLQLLRAEYGVATEIDPDQEVVIDRSLDSSRFRAALGYEPPAWPAQIAAMRAFGTGAANEGRSDV